MLYSSIKTEIIIIVDRHNLQQLAGPLENLAKLWHFVCVRKCLRNTCHWKWAISTTLKTRRAHWPRDFQAMLRKETKFWLIHLRNKQKCTTDYFSQKTKISSGHPDSESPWCHAYKLTESLMKSIWLFHKNTIFIILQTVVLCQLCKWIYFKFYIVKAKFQFLGREFTNLGGSAEARAKLRSRVFPFTGLLSTSESDIRGPQLDSIFGRTT